jgi:hypothetical protein
MLAAVSMVCVHIYMTMRACSFHAMARQSHSHCLLPVRSMDLQ